MHLPNNAFERTAGSHALATAAQRGRSTHMGRYPALLVLLVALVVLDACSIRLPGRDQTELTCLSVAGDDYYFPVNALDPRDPRGDGFRRRWYSSHLLAMGEPSLSCGPESRETYRFVWLRTFHRPISVRATKHHNVAKLTVVELDGAGGYAPGKVASTVEKELSRKDWAMLETTLAAIDFWKMPARSGVDDLGLDGAQWIVEGRRPDKYHIVDRWSPRTGPYREVGLWFLKAAGVKALGQELY